MTTSEVAVATIAQIFSPLSSHGTTSAQPTFGISMAATSRGLDGKGLRLVPPARASAAI